MNPKSDNRKNKCFFILAVIFLLVLLSVSLRNSNYITDENTHKGIIEETFPTSGSGSYPPPPIGDWIISNETYIQNETIILTGNLTVQNGGNLILRNATLMINNSYDGQYGIEVKSGGEMLVCDYDNVSITMNDSTNITVFNESNRMFFIVEKGSNFRMSNSELHYVGFSIIPLEHSGLFIETRAAVVEYSLISNNYGGIILSDSVETSITNNAIIHNQGIGLQMMGSANTTLASNNISNNSAGITCGGSPNTTILNNLISNNAGVGITYIDSSGLIISNNRIINNSLGGINIQRSSNLTIMDNEISMNGVRGIYLVTSSPVIENNILLNNDNGIWPYWYSNATIINTTIENSANFDFYIWNSNPSTLNTTFNRSEVYFEDAPSTLTVQWYLHTKVIDTNNDPIVGASVEVKDINEDLILSGNTGSDGCIRFIVSKEYIQNDANGDNDGEDPGEKIFFTPHNVTVSKDGYIGYADPEPNMNASKEVIVRLPVAYTTYTIRKSPHQGNATVDGTQYSVPAVFSWLSGDIHTISVDSPESCGANCRYAYDYWDDSGLQTHDVTVGSVDTVVTAYYFTQYKPAIALNGTDNIHAVAAHYAQGGSQVNDQGNFNSWSDWVDENTTLSFDECTSGSPTRCTKDIRTWTVASAFNATINYTAENVDTVKEMNYKPFVALIFCIILFLVGAYVTNKKPLKLRDSEKRNKMYNLLFVVMPFVIIEAITGIISLLTGLLSIPPLIGPGTIVDLFILICGLLAFALIYKGKIKRED